jgi:hypothetical protein
MSAMIKKPVNTQRKLPLGVDFPQHLILRTEITLPEAWAWDKETKNILDPAFSFRKQSFRTGKNWWWNMSIGRWPTRGRRNAPINICKTRGGFQNLGRFAGLEVKSRAGGRPRCATGLARHRKQCPGKTETGIAI